MKLYSGKFTQWSDLRSRQSFVEELMESQGA